MASRSTTMLARTVANAASLGHASSSVLIPAVTSSTSRTLSSSARQRQQDKEEESVSEPLSRPRRDPNRDTAIQSRPKAKSAQESASALHPTRPTIRDPRMYLAPTQWQSPLWRFPSPPTETSRFIPPMEDRQPLKASSKTPPRPTMGPGGSNWTNIKYAYRSLQMRVHNAGHNIGPNGHFRGVYYKRLPKADDVSATAQQFDPAKGSKQNFLERAGGDYSRYTPSRNRPMDPYDWKSTVDYAFAANADIPPQTRLKFKSKINDILEGKPQVARTITMSQTTGGADKKK